MQANVVPIIKQTLKKSKICKAQLLVIAKRAQNYVKPFKPKVDSRSLVFSSISTKDNTNKSFNIQSSEIHKTKEFDHVYQTTRPIDLRAYSISAPESGIAGFVEDVEMDSIPYYKVPWNNLKKHNNKINLAKNELSSIYVLLKLYTNKFHGKRVAIYCDNVSVIGMLNATKTNEIQPELKPIINEIKSICNENKITPIWQRIIGVPEIAADRLIHGVDSPFQYSSFKAQAQPDTMGLQHLNDIFNIC